MHLSRYDPCKVNLQSQNVWRKNVMHIAECSTNPQWQPPSTVLFQRDLDESARISYFIVGVVITYLLISLLIPKPIFSSKHDKLLELDIWRKFVSRSKKRSWRERTLFRCCWYEGSASFCWNNIQQFCYFASIDSHSQLSAYSKETHPTSRCKQPRNML